TGYPPEVVDLDADMEADLGIDSIKKAQLFGELREQFGLRIESAEQLALDDFPTLRHVLAFLREQGVNPDQAGGPDVADTTAMTPPLASAPASTIVAPDGALARLNLVHLAGTPYEMGRQHGERFGDDIRRTLVAYRDLLDRSAPGTVARLPEIVDELMERASDYLDADALAELQGMADVLEIPVGHLIALNLGLNADYAPGCTQFAITARRNGSSGLLHAANEDWPLALKLPGSLTRLVAVRHPEGGIPHLLFTAAGEAGGVNGINARGLAVTSTALLDRDWAVADRSGTVHPVIVRTILERADSIEAALELLRGFTRVGAWSMCLSHAATDRVAYVEYDHDDLQVDLARDGVVSANHCLLFPSSAAVPADSRHRLTRLDGLVGPETWGTLSPADVRRALRDRFDLGRGRETAHPTMNTVLRVDNQTSIVLQPARGRAWATDGARGREDLDPYVELDLVELLGLEPVDGPAPELAAAHTNGLATAPSALDATVPAPRPGAAVVPSDHVMRRFVLRLADAPLPAPVVGQPEPEALRGRTLLVGDNPTASALAARLRATGNEPLALAESGDHEATLAAFDRLWAGGPIPNLVLLTGRDAAASGDLTVASWAERRERGIMLPYLLCQRWVQRVEEAGLGDAATLTAVTGLGGDFGLSGDAGAVEGGGLAGLLKAIRREFGWRVKVVDAPVDERPDSVVAAVLTELASRTPEVEVGYTRGSRRLVRAVPRPVPPATRALVAGQAWVVTGGARGVTAAVAHELGRRFGLRLHLLGTSPALAPSDEALLTADERALRAATTRRARESGADPALAWQRLERSMEIARTLRRFADDGIAATYHVCDVADRAALALVLDEIRAVDGPIHGVVHGAGVESAARFARKRVDRVRATLAGKIDGAVALMELTRTDPLDYFVGFGSVSGRFGGLGQTDYSMASDLLVALVQRFRAERPNCAAVTLAWPAWGEVGMAMRPESRFTLELGEQQFMPPLEGAEHLIDELLAGAPEGEVVTLDRPGRLDLDGTMPDPETQRGYERREPAVADAPLVEGIRHLDEGRGLVAELFFDPRHDPFLAGHRFRGTPLVPSVVWLESLVEAASVFEPQERDGFPPTLRDVEILNGLRFYADRPARVDVSLTRGEEGLAAEVAGRFVNRQGKVIDPRRVFVRGTVEFNEEAPDHTGPSWSPPDPASWIDVAYPDPDTAPTALVFHGPEFRTLRRLALAEDGGWGELEAPEAAALGGDRRGHWRIPAAVIDGALVASGAFVKHSLQLDHLPRGFGAVRVTRLPGPGERCRTRFTFRGRRDDELSFDLVVWGEDGSPLVRIEGYRAVVLPASAQ
ncbi:MAG TPA: C45 family autoproteolytic acyltransferase/hydrolase, partial [Thermomicrobiaceae bacterium]|nr:C45 family autoproteolytic acyltransferase/hydrolase [Thermomicrobiaceae bacterium]